MSALTGPEFANRLRGLAALYDSEPDMPVPGFTVRLTSRSDCAVAGYLALRRLFPDAPVDDSDTSFVYVQTEGVAFGFWKSDIGEKRTVTRDVVEYVLPEAESTPVEDVFDHTANGIFS